MTPLTRTSTLRRLGLTVAALAFTAGGLTACGGDDSSDSAGASAGDSAGDSTAASPSASSSDDSSDDSGDDSSDDSSGGDVSVADFCGAYSAYFRQLAKAASPNDLDIKAIKEFSEKLGELGTPAGIPDDARNGFEVSVKAAEDLPDDATTADLAKLQNDISADDQADAMAFGQYVVKTCPDLVADLAPSGVPSS